MTPNETLAVALIEHVAHHNPAVLAPAEAIVLGRIEWGYVEARREILSSNDRAIVDLAWDSFTIGTGSLAAALRRLEPARIATILELVNEAYG